MTNIKLSMVTVLSFFLFFIFSLIFTNGTQAQEVFLSKEDFLKTAFEEDVPRRKGLRFKKEVKETAQKIMGSNYKKIRMKYQLKNLEKNAEILQKNGLMFTKHNSRD